MSTIYKSVKEYCESTPNHCPNIHCQSSVIEGASIDIDGRTAVQEVICNQCGCSWKDIYTLTSYELTE